jgi:hypothetical protein
LNDERCDTDTTFLQGSIRIFGALVPGMVAFSNFSFDFFWVLRKNFQKKTKKKKRPTVY